MTPTRQGAPGRTRICPHCRQTILESATACPACRHHLRFIGVDGARGFATFSPLVVEAAVVHPRDAEAWEYSIVVSVFGEDGAEIARQVVAVGVMDAEVRRSFRCSVDVTVPKSGGR